MLGGPVAAEAAGPMAADRLGPSPCQLPAPRASAPGALGLNVPTGE